MLLASEAYPCKTGWGQFNMALDPCGPIISTECASCNLTCLQAGITTADRVVTVSPGYAGEIRTYLGGWGMEGLLNERAPVLNGIVNGIDVE